jgi:hypothetical protein
MTCISTKGAASPAWLVSITCRKRVREVLSMQRGESPFYPTFGMRFFEYFEAYRGTLWLDQLFKLDVVRGHLARAKWMTERGYRHLLRTANDQ